jgi:2-succinyl-5-enolpyruvyl-6-hydroxy-3-cyclohexene-1-carboxylate synthase
MANPLVILGALAEDDRPRVREFAIALNAPVYAVALSGMREDPALEHLNIKSGERIIGTGNFDGVIRIGGVPTLRFWRDLDEAKRDLPVISYSSVRFTGLSRGEVQSLESLPEPNAVHRDAAFFERDAAIAAKIGRILDEEKTSEPAIFRALSRELPPRSRVYLGNSLPIREWDLFASRAPRGFVYEANRGANGIDGQLSTFFGWCTDDAENVAIIGDLTALYDLNAPWIVPQLDPGTRLRIFIVNNGGGRIFSRVASLKAMDPAVKSRIVENEHSLRFAKWAAMWDLEERVIEKVPDSDATRRAWEKYDALWS